MLILLKILHFNYKGIGCGSVFLRKHMYLFENMQHLIVQTVSRARVAVA